MNEKLRLIPKVDEMLAHPALCGVGGHLLLVEAVRNVLEGLREGILRGGAEVMGAALRDVGGEVCVPSPDVVAGLVLARLAGIRHRSLRRVVNGTGVVLHTNFGRAPLAEDALTAVMETARGYSNLEYDIAGAARGSRQAHVEGLLTRLTGAEAAMVVNNNAAAVLLALAAVASGADVITSRGELVEIGGAFRIPDVCVQSGCRLVEVGTTNRTHIKDYAQVLDMMNTTEATQAPNNKIITGTVLPSDIKNATETVLTPDTKNMLETVLTPDTKNTPGTVLTSDIKNMAGTMLTSDNKKTPGTVGRVGAILRVHASNFKMTGFVSRPALGELAALARAWGVPLIEDLGSGALIDIFRADTFRAGQSRPDCACPTVTDSINGGADLVTFSGDKLLGGPQAGLVVGRADLIALMRTHPLARAVRIDKLSLAALEATLRLYLDPEEAAEKIPVLRMLRAAPEELRAKAERLCAAMARVEVGIDNKKAAAPPCSTSGEITEVECNLLQHDKITKVECNLLQHEESPHLRVVPIDGQAGGGAMPEESLPSWAVAVTNPAFSAQEIERIFRMGTAAFKNNTDASTIHPIAPAVIGRISQEQFLLDVRTIDEDEFPHVAERYVLVCAYTVVNG